MADRVYPSAPKPVPPPPAAQHPTTTTTNGATTNGNSLNFPPTKAQAYRPQYRPQGIRPEPRQQRRQRARCSCRRFCCCFILWLIFFIIAVGLLAAIVGTVFYILYQPEKPTFTLTAFTVTQFNVSASVKDPTVSYLNARYNMSVIAKNPNKKMKISYNDIYVSMAVDEDKDNSLNVGSGNINGFVLESKNKTSIKTVMGTGKGGQELEMEDAKKLKNHLKKGAMPLVVMFETKVKLKIGNVKLKKFGIRVKCEGIKGVVPTGKVVKESNGVSNAKCKVKLRIKIWKWYF